MTETITFIHVCDIVSDLVKERGYGYIYPAKIHDGVRVCHNWDTVNDTPGCIVGAVLHRLGATKEDLLRRNGIGSHSMILALEQEAGWKFEESVPLYLSELQRAQDNGATWGYAADNAINHIRKSEELQDLRKLLREDLWKLLRDEEDVHNEQSTSDTVA